MPQTHTRAFHKSTSSNGQFCIKRVEEGSAAALSKQVKAGDVLLAVDRHPVHGLDKLELGAHTVMPCKPNVRTFDDIDSYSLY